MDLIREARRSLVQPVLRLLKALSLSLCIAFIAVEAVYVGPPTPLREELFPLWDVAVARLLFQSWGFFHSPPQEQYAVRVRCSSSAGASDWIDLSEKVLEGNGRRPFGVTNRAAYFLQEAASQEQDLRRLAAAAKTGEGTAETFQGARRDETERWARVGSEACKDLFGSTWPEAVEVEYRVQRSLTWEQRNASSLPTFTVVSVGTFPIRADVAALGLFEKQRTP